MDVARTMTNQANNLKSTDLVLCLLVYVLFCFVYLFVLGFFLVFYIALSYTNEVFVTADRMTVKILPIRLQMQSWQSTLQLDAGT